MDNQYKNVYVGNRYVPKPAGVWDKEKKYESLSIVLHEGSSYTSKKNVPSGIDIHDEEYWSLTGNYNAQVENYRRDVRDMENRVSQELEETVVNVNQKLEETSDEINRRGIDVRNYKHFIPNVNVLSDLEGVDWTPAFIEASNIANNLGSPLLVTDGNYYIAGTVPIYTDVIGNGKIILDFNDEGYAFEINSNKPLLKLSNPNALRGLEEDSTRIEGLPPNLVGASLFIRSHEVLIKRNHADDPEYYKRDSFVIQDEKGTVLPPVDDTYNDLSLIHTAMYREKEDKPLIWDGVTFEYKGSIQGDRRTILVQRSDVEVNTFIFNPSLALEINTGIRVEWATNVDFNVYIHGANFDGFGYGISIGSASFIRFKDCEMLDCRHAISGRHGKDITVDGGRYSDIDSHWGVDYKIKNAIVMNPIQYAGKNISVKDSTIFTPYSAVVLRDDTPELRGTVEQDNLDVYKVQNGAPTGTNLLYINCKPKNEFDWGRELRLPHTFKSKNIRVHGESDLVETLKIGVEGFYQNHKPIEKIEVKNIQSGDAFVRLQNTAVKHEFILPSKNPKVILKDIEDLRIVLWDETKSTDKFLVELEIDKCGKVDFRAESSLLGDTVINRSHVTHIHPHEYDLPLGGDITFMYCLITGQLRIENYFNVYHCIFKDNTNFNNTYLREKIKIAKGNVLELGSELDPRLIDYVNPIFYETETV